jgi:hypothetical protein
MRPYVKVAVVAISCFLFATIAGATIPAGYTSTPFSFDTLMGHPQGIPGVVKAVFFDNGGEAVAFHYPGGNQGGSMRLNAAKQQIQADFVVSMQSYSGNDWDVVGYGTNDQHDSSVNATITTWHLSWLDAASPTDPGEWLKYTVHVNTAGTYSIDFKMAEAYDPPNLQLLTFYNGTTVRVDSIKNLPKCITPQGCPEVWHAWTLMANVDTITLDTGLQVIKLAFITGSWNFDWMRFTLKSTSTAQPVFTRPEFNSLGLKTTLSGDILSISYNQPLSSATRISLVDCTGRAVLSNAVPIGTQYQTLSVRNIRQGVYFVNVEHNGIREAKSITITH